MRAFDLDRSLIGNYEAFSRSFTRIRASDLKQAIDQRYADGRFWPDALLSMAERGRFEARRGLAGWRWKRAAPVHRASATGDDTRPSNGRAGPDRGHAAR